jgi:hypothetical protein
MPATPPDLPTALQHIKHVLAEIDRGAGFCEDRGFGWTIENERCAGIDDVRALFDTRPELSTRLPKLAELLADRTRVIGLHTLPHDELKAAIRKVKRDARNQERP